MLSSVPAEEQAEFEQLSREIQELQQLLNQDFRQKTVRAVGLMPRRRVWGGGGHMCSDHSKTTVCVGSSEAPWVVVPKVDALLETRVSEGFPVSHLWAPDCTGALDTTHTLLVLQARRRFWGARVFGTCRVPGGLSSGCHSRASVWATGCQTQVPHSCRDRAAP